MRKIIIAVIAALAASFPLSAQRTAAGSWYVDVDAVCTFQSLGAQASFGYYMLHSYVGGGANAAIRTVRQDTGTLQYNLPYVQYTATADFMYRLAGTRTRWFTLNGGGGVLLGAEVYDPKNQRPEGVTLSETGGTFIYGVDVRLEMEFYPFRRFGFVVGSRMPLTFGSLCSIFNIDVFAGIRVNI